MSRYLKSILPAVGTLAIICGGPVLADIEKGERLYRQCQGCHSIGPDAPNGFGPQLNGVFARDAGSVEGYDYSPAFKKAVSQGLRWNSTTLDEFLLAPMDSIRGTRMAFPGIIDVDDRNELIDYLKHIGLDGKLPATKKVKAIRQKAQAALSPLPAEVTIPDHGLLHLGRIALDEEVIAWDIDIRPDGMGLPPGQGSVVDGTELYDNSCAACHGIFGEGSGRWPVLAGGQGTLVDDRPEKTIGSYWPYLSTVFDYVRRAMPFGNARSLSDDDVYAITAYLLFLNDLVEEDFVLTSTNFTTVKLPNEINFIADTREEEVAAAGMAEPCMSNCFAEPARVTQRARILDVTPDDEDDQSNSALIE